MSELVHFMTKARTEEEVFGKAAVKFSSDKKFVVNDIVGYENGVYKCIVEHEPAVWNPSHFKRLLVGEVEDHINDKNNPHQVSASQVQAVPLVGDSTINGSLTIRASDDTEESASTTYAKITNTEIAIEANADGGTYAILNASKVKFGNSSKNTELNFDGISRFESGTDKSLSFPNKAGTIAINSDIDGKSDAATKEVNEFKCVAQTDTYTGTMVLTIPNIKVPNKDVSATLDGVQVDVTVVYDDTAFRWKYTFPEEINAGWTSYYTLLGSDKHLESEAFGRYTQSIAQVKDSTIAADSAKFCGLDSSAFVKKVHLYRYDDGEIILFGIIGGIGDGNAIAFVDGEEKEVYFTESTEVLRWDIQDIFEAWSVNKSSEGTFEFADVKFGDATPEIPGEFALADGLTPPAIKSLFTESAFKTAADTEVAHTIGGYDKYEKKTYSKGDVVEHDGKLWECNADITKAEYWNSAHWTRTYIKSQIPEVVAPDGSDSISTTDARAISAGRAKKELDKKCDVFMSGIRGTATSGDSLNKYEFFIGCTGYFWKPTDGVSARCWMIDSSLNTADYLSLSVESNGVLNININDEDITSVITINSGTVSHVDSYGTIDSIELVQSLDNKFMPFVSFASTSLTQNGKQALLSDVAKTLIGYKEYEKRNYSAGTIVVHDGKLWVCTEDISGGGEEWNADHWMYVRENEIFLTQQGVGTLETLTVNTLNIPYGFVNGKSYTTIILPESSKDVTLATTENTEAIRLGSAKVSEWSKGDVSIPFSDGSRLYVRFYTPTSTSYIKYISSSGEVLVEQSGKKYFPQLYTDTDGNPILRIYTKGSSAAFCTTSQEVLISNSAIKAEKSYTTDTRPAALASELTPTAFDILTSVYNDKYLSRTDVVTPDSSDLVSGKAADAQKTCAALKIAKCDLGGNPNVVLYTYTDGDAILGGRMVYRESESCDAILVNISNNNYLYANYGGFERWWYLSKDQQGVFDIAFYWTVNPGLGGPPSSSVFTYDYDTKTSANAANLTDAGKQSLFSSDGFDSYITETAPDNSLAGIVRDLRGSIGDIKTALVAINGEES